MGGALMMSLGAERLRLDTTVHAADFGGGVAGYFDGVGGSMDDYTFTDGAGNSRTINAVYGDGGNDTLGVLSLTDTGAPNTDATFRYIIVDGAKYLRSAASYASGVWTWGNGFFVGGPGDHGLQVWA